MPLRRHKRLGHQPLRAAATRGGPVKRRLSFSQLPPERLWKRLYLQQQDQDSEYLEHLSGFRPGGYFPVHLQEKLCDNQYQVIHKLGHGGYATVWLCRDTHADKPTYVAIKILMAKETERECREMKAAALLQGQYTEDVSGYQALSLPLRHFTCESPSGTHICLVHHILGPSVKYARGIYQTEENLVEILQSISRQAVEGLSRLHKQGVCHGGIDGFWIFFLNHLANLKADFHPRNILLGLRDVNGLEEDEVLELLEEPQSVAISVRADSHPTPQIPYAPKYLVYPVDFEYLDESLVLPSVQIIDFGQSFNTTHQPLPAMFGIPVNYAAPEIIFDKSGGTAMDLWSLGCTLYEIRTGRTLFEVPQLVGLNRKEYMRTIASLLLEPPEKWEEYYSESDLSDDDADLTDSSSGTEELGNARIREERILSIKERLGSCHTCFLDNCKHPRFDVISEAEATALADLLERVLKYSPEERPSAEEVLSHPWFHTRYIGADSQHTE